MDAMSNTNVYGRHNSLTMYGVRLCDMLWASLENTTTTINDVIFKYSKILENCHKYILWPCIVSLTNREGNEKVRVFVHAGVVTEVRLLSEAACPYKEHSAH